MQAIQSEKPWGQRDSWPANWICPGNEVAESAVYAFRLVIDLEQPLQTRIHVSADQRYWLYLNGERIGMGSERGCVAEWYFESYALELPPGRHEFGALVWFLTSKAPWAQDTIRPGFLLAAEEPGTDSLSTGRAPWQSRLMPEAGFLDPGEQINDLIGCGARVRLHADGWKGALADHGDWAPVRKLMAGNNGFWQNASPQTWILQPGSLPGMRSAPLEGLGARLVAPYEDPAAPLETGESLPHEVADWDRILRGSGATLSIPPQTRRRILIDPGKYLCAYYRLRTSGGEGSRIRIGWAERLSIRPDQNTAPDERRQVDGRFFVGTFDQFEPSGKETAELEPLWWQAGRWIQIVIETSDCPLEVREFALLETGFPLEDNGRFETPDASLSRILTACRRTLACCAHETYMDCPYWEQLQYIGDTRIQILMTYALSLDDRLPRKAVDIYRKSMGGASPFPASNFPSRSTQIIPPFALWWIGMVHDAALWRGSPKQARERLPACWWILDHFLQNRSPEGMVRSPRGWNYVDATAFPGGEPAGANEGELSGLLNWQLVLALDAVADLEEWTGEPERHQRARRLAAELSQACCEQLWNDQRMALADDPGQAGFSEHGQTLALLSGRLPPEIERQSAKALLHDPALNRAGLYFSHYVCLALHRTGEGEALLKRIRTWEPFLQAGLSTFPEHDLAGRSDCHAWSAHPLFHMLHSVAGIRPGALGFHSVVIEPQPGSLPAFQASMPHPAGDIEVSMTRDGSCRRFSIKLPAGLGGSFIWNRALTPLQSGNQDLTVW